MQLLDPRTQVNNYWWNISQVNRHNQKRRAGGIRRQMERGRCPTNSIGLAKFYLRQAGIISVAKSGPEIYVDIIFFSIS